MDNKTDFIVVLPKTIITIPQDSYLAWLTLFYALPRLLSRILANLCVDSDVR